ncbi:hypothetical protein SAMN05660464_3699 [Geodermatophilus dictyosporus]|uniref:Uncharacterized protein n=2 Tax=Geodermatophilus dictyosporus TaxID=1523247 RepID=A0A1I5RSQ6_9ACTN|nr:hypothetical protein SAMN05660464_3699 [Geodermatophilus dictyosporus]
MKTINPEALAEYVVRATGLEPVLVTTVLAVEHEYMYALGLIDGPEPAWLWYDRDDLRGHPPEVNDDEIAAHVEATLAIPQEETLAVLAAEMDYLAAHGLVSW